jgi:hypothetical protein
VRNDRCDNTGRVLEKPAMSTNTTDEETSIEQKYIDELRHSADLIRRDLEALADALEDGTADKTDVVRAAKSLSLTYIDIEDSADICGVVDTEEPAFRAMNEARKVIYHIAQGDSEAAITAATTAAKYAEQDLEESQE